MLATWLCFKWCERQFCIKVPFAYDPLWWLKKPLELGDWITLPAEPSPHPWKADVVLLASAAALVAETQHVPAGSNLVRSMHNEIQRLVTEHLGDGVQVTAKQSAAAPARPVQ